MTTLLLQAVKATHQLRQLCTAQVRRRICDDARLSGNSAMCIAVLWLLLQFFQRYSSGIGTSPGPWMHCRLFDDEDGHNAHLYTLVHTCMDMPPLTSWGARVACSRSAASAQVQQLARLHACTDTVWYQICH
jgi:hypothetical protein